MVCFMIFCCTAAWTLAAIPASSAPQYAQYYPPPSYYGRPPCQAVTPGPFRGADRGAAGGALIGAIGGNAGRGAAVGAGVGAVGGAVPRGTARSSGYVTDAGPRVDLLRNAKGREMNARFVPVLLALWLGSSAPQTQQPALAAVSPAPATSPAPSPSTPAPEAQIAPGLWEVEHTRCSNLLGAADDDKAAAAMFYYGYLAAKAGIHVIDVRKIDENVGKVMKQYAATPNITVPQAFREALQPRRSSG